MNKLPKHRSMKKLILLLVTLLSINIARARTLSRKLTEKLDREIRLCKLWMAITLLLAL